MKRAIKKYFHYRLELNKKIEIIQGVIKTLIDKGIAFIINMQDVMLGRILEGRDVILNKIKEGRDVMLDEIKEVKAEMKKPKYVEKVVWIMMLIWVSIILKTEWFYEEFFLVEINKTYKYKPVTYMDINYIIKNLPRIILDNEQKVWSSIDAVEPAKKRRINRPSNFTLGFIPEKTADYNSEKVILKDLKLILENQNTLELGFIVLKNKNNNKIFGEGMPAEMMVFYDKYVADQLKIENKKECKLVSFNIENIEYIEGTLERYNCFFFGTKGFLEAKRAYYNIDNAKYEVIIVVMYDEILNKELIDCNIKTIFELNFTNTALKLYRFTASLSNFEEMHICVAKYMEQWKIINKGDLNEGIVAIYEKDGVGGYRLHLIPIRLN